MMYISDTVLILCLSCRKITLIHRCLYFYFNPKEISLDCPFWSLTGRNIAFLVPLSHVTCWEARYKFSSLPVDRKYQKGQSREKWKQRKHLIRIMSSCILDTLLSFMFLFFFSSPCQRQCELLPSLGVRRLSSVNFSHFNLLLWNSSAKWTETW
jgi:hypothetical protein